MHVLISFLLKRICCGGYRMVLTLCCISALVALHSLACPVHAGERESQKGETSGSIEESDEGHVHNMPSIIYMYMRDVGRIAVATATMCWGFVWVIFVGSMIWMDPRKAMAMKKAAKKTASVQKAMKAMTKKPTAWLKKAPRGCSKCRHMPGCTLSCWTKRGGPP